MAMYDKLILNVKCVNCKIEREMKLKTRGLSRTNQTYKINDILTDRYGRIYIKEGFIWADGNCDCGYANYVKCKIVDGKLDSILEISSD